MISGCCFLLRHHKPQISETTYLRSEQFHKLLLNFEGTHWEARQRLLWIALPPLSSFSPPFHPLSLSLSLWMIPSDMFPVPGPLTVSIKAREREKERLSGFQGFGCCSALFSPLIRRADIQPSTTTPGALGIKGLHTDFREGEGGEDIWEVDNTKRNNIEKNRENEQVERMQNEEWKEGTDRG